MKARDTMTKAVRNEQNDSITYLRSILKPGDTVYTILNNVSRSGMNRHISLAVGSGKEVNNITWHVARALGEPVKNRSGYVQDVGISVSGCGMDMGFEIVYRLSSALFHDGFKCIGEGCGSNDHSNDYQKFKNYKGKIHTGGGGYALKHRWL